MRELCTITLPCLLWLAACGQSATDTPPKAASREPPPLIAIAERGDLPALDALLAGGSAPDVYDACRWTPLMKAAQNGHFSTARRLLAAGADPDVADKGGYTALMLAAANGHAALAALLLDHGADIDRRETSMGWTALIWAVKNGRTDSVSMLLRRGAAAGLRDLAGRDANDWAVTTGDEGLAALFQDHRSAANRE